MTDSKTSAYDSWESSLKKIINDHSKLYLVNLKAYYVQIQPRKREKCVIHASISVTSYASYRYRGADVLDDQFKWKDDVNV